MRNVIVVMLAAIVANMCFAQAPQRTGPLNRLRLNRNRVAEEEKFRQTYPSGTNEFGRTWTVQCEYEAFMKENPSGKDPFGMTFEEQQQFQLVQDKLKALSQAKCTFEQAKSKFETLSAMKERTSALSEDAKKLYEQEFAEAKSKVEKAKADLDQLEASLTPETVAEYERKKQAYDLKKKVLEDEKKAKEQKAKKAKEEYEALKWEMAQGSVVPAVISSMVKIPGKDYLIGKTEVTQEIWEKVMGNNPAHFKGPNRPVENVSWYDCQAFVEKLNAASAVKSAKLRFRLPTEEEWEFACRAGGKGDWGKRANGEEGPLDAMGWYNGNSGSETHPVAQKEANAFGLYDMHGNVWEWTSTADGDNHVDRGGSWFYDSWICTAGYRYWYPPAYREYFLGFRLAASQD